MTDQPNVDRAPTDPDSYVQGEAETLLSVLGSFERAGFRGQFDERDGRIRCLTCREVAEPDAVAVERFRRLEGASDPDDMLAVVALRCPHCGTPGTLVAGYGPEASPGDSEVLSRLPEPARAD